MVNNILLTTCHVCRKEIYSCESSELLAAMLQDDATDAQIAGA